jgi:hypothetical protein
MKKFLVLAVFILPLQPASAAGFLCAIPYGPPLPYYGQFFEQCYEITVTAGQELACMARYVAADPPPPIAAPQVRAFFKRGWSLIAAEHRGLISNGEALAQLNRDIIDTQYAVAAKVQEAFYRCETRRCSFASPPFCNGY